VLVWAMFVWPNQSRIVCNGTRVKPPGARLSSQIVEMQVDRFKRSA
jgi:hypothetical protein